MFLGHIGLAFASKRVAPQVSLGYLVAATTFVDLIWPMMLLFNIEQVSIEPGITTVNPLNFTYYPYTHSLVASVVWGLVFAGFMMMRKYSWKPALLCAVLVVSHWFLDLLVHRPDLTLAGESGPGYGFALWNSFAGTLIAEGIVFFGGVILYVKQTKATSSIGSYVLWSLLVLLVAIYVASVWGPPPPSAQAIGYAGISMWLFVVMAALADRNRIANSE